MNIINNFKPLSRLSLLHFTKTGFRNYSFVPRKCNWCQTWTRSPSVFITKHQRHSVFCSSRFSHNDPPPSQEEEVSDSGSVSQGSFKTFSLDVLVALLRQENAVDICVVKIPKHINYAEYFVVVSGLSTRHLKAMALYAVKVHKYLRKSHESHVKIEGQNAEDWMCIDFGNIVVHFMLPECREVYELEKLWTLRSFDEQLRNMPLEKLPEDFMFDLDVSK